MQNVVVFESGAWGITYIRLSFVYSSRRSELIHEVFLEYKMCSPHSTRAIGRF